MAFRWKIFRTIHPMKMGNAIFAGANSRSLTEQYNQSYKQGILEVTIDQETYDRLFKPLERTYQGGSYIELPIPHDLFPTLNKFPRVLKRE